MEVPNKSLHAPLSLLQTNESVAAGLPIDFWTIDLRSALLALGEVSGDEVSTVCMALGCMAGVAIRARVTALDVALLCNISRAFTSKPKQCPDHGVFCRSQRRSSTTSSVGSASASEHTSEGKHPVFWRSNWI